MHRSCDSGESRLRADLPSEPSNRSLARRVPGSSDGGFETPETAHPVSRRRACREVRGTLGGRESQRHGVTSPPDGAEWIRPATRHIGQGWVAPLFPLRRAPPALPVVLVTSGNWPRRPNHFSFLSLVVIGKQMVGGRDSRGSRPRHERKTKYNSWRWITRLVRR